MSDFEQIFQELNRDKEEVAKRFEEAKKDAIAHIKPIIKAFGIEASDLFTDKKKAKRAYAPVPIKYRLPNGVEWTGKGRVKKEVQEYLDAHNMTKDDLEQFHV